MSEAEKYFKKLHKEAKYYKSYSAAFSKWDYLLSIGFGYSEVINIIKERRYANERTEKLTKVIDSHILWNRNKICKYFKINSSRLAMVLNGDSTSIDLLDNIESKLKQYNKNTLKKQL